MKKYYYGTKLLEKYLKNAFFFRDVSEIVQTSIFQNYRMGTKNHDEQCPSGRKKLKTRNQETERR